MKDIGQARYRLLEYIHNSNTSTASSCSPPLFNSSKLSLALCGPFFWPHRLFTANDVAGIDTPTSLINPNSKTTDTAFINIALLYALFSDFFCRLLFDHGIPLLAVGKIFFIPLEFTTKYTYLLRASSSYFFEHFLGSAADWTGPIVRDLVKRCAGAYSSIGIPFFWVVDVTTDIALVLDHS